MGVGVGDGLIRGDAGIAVQPLGVALIESMQVGNDAVVNDSTADGLEGECCKTV